MQFKFTRGILELLFFRCCGWTGAGGTHLDMASSHLADLSQAWDNYMDCRAQGADLQVSASRRQTLFVRLVKDLLYKALKSESYAV